MDTGHFSNLESSPKYWSRYTVTTKPLSIDAKGNLGPACAIIQGSDNTSVPQLFVFYATMFPGPNPPGPRDGGAINVRSFALRSQPEDEYGALAVSPGIGYINSSNFGNVCQVPILPNVWTDCEFYPINAVAVESNLFCFYRSTTGAGVALLQAVLNATATFSTGDGGVKNLSYKVVAPGDHFVSTSTIPSGWVNGST